MHRGLFITVKVLFSLLVATLIVTYPSQRSTVASQKDREIDLRTAPGRLISEGRNTKPVGPNKLLTYKLEELDLPRPRQIISNGQKRQVTTVLRLTITAQVFQGGANVIWIDDTVFPSPWEAVRGLGTLIYDTSLLKDGATISAGPIQEPYDLPERLRLPRSFNLPSLPETSQERGRITSMRSIQKTIDGKSQPYISIEITTLPLPVMNSRYSLQIGRRFFWNLYGGESHWRLELSARDFKELKEGSRVAVTHGPVRVVDVGRLNKKMLDRN
jgi:hypothetical protein